MANAYKNKVVYNGNTLIDLSDTTAVAADVNSGKYVYLADGSRVQGSQTVYTVSETLTHITSTNQATKVISGDSFHAVLTPDSGYRIESITVTMGGVDITSQVFSPGTGAKAITSNGTYNASDDNFGGYSSVMVNVSGGSSPTLQNKTATFTPTTSQQTQTVTADNGYDGLSSVGITVDAIPSQYVVPSGSQTITVNNTYDVTSLASVVVNVPSSGLTAASGTVTFSTTYNTTGNREITTLANIGFTPTKFYFFVDNINDLNTTQYAIIRESYESLGTSTPYNYRVATRYSNSTGSISASNSNTAWTTQTNYYLYNDGSKIYVRTTNTFILLPSITYRWLALA